MANRVPMVMGSDGLMQQHQAADTAAHPGAVTAPSGTIAGAWAVNSLTVNGVAVTPANYGTLSGSNTWAGLNAFQSQVQAQAGLAYGAALSTISTMALNTPIHDVTPNAASVANGASINFANFSGLVAVLNQTNAGFDLFLLSGGGVTKLLSGSTSSVTSFAYNGGIAGYIFNNGYGAAATFAFFSIRMRTTA